MTRLRTEWITYMLDGMDDYNRSLAARTGMDLAGLVMETFGVSKADFDAARSSVRVAVVPVTQGEGIIGSFAQSVAAIILSMGFQADVMEHTDVDGIYDASRGGYQVLFLADDIRYLALNIRSGLYSDNNYATALGFIRALFAMMRKAGKDPMSEKILQIGYGIVGKESAKILTAAGVDFDLYDKDRSAVSDFSGKILSGKNEISAYQYILDFTNEGGWLRREDLREDVLYASPGVPYSIEEDAAASFEERAVHDNLEIGTAIMLGESLFGKPKALI